jgi:periplasmic copper chaperone A
MKLHSLKLALLCAAGFTTAAQAHVSFVNNINAYSGSDSVVTIQFTHGCQVNHAGPYFDTTEVEVTIPAGFTGVTPMDSVFGPASIEKDEAGNVTKIIWTKDESDARDEDILYTQLSFRGKPAANSAFTQLEFPTTQTCSGGGDPAVWEGVGVPKLKVYDTRKLGWNKYTAQSALDAAALTAYFGDAQIVWYNNAAYSANPVTRALINTALTTIPAAGEFWVKY